ncbi:hypothetical protein [Streptomyces sp. KR80]|uniref:hypothetical protein n=1 Tax=Streptomyces sp. KR80 TaxID=3457426 RepID=UPI003FD02AB2
MVGRRVHAARAAARAAGFAEPRTYDALGRDRRQVVGQQWKVCTQEPRPGPVEPTAEITLGVVRLDEPCPGTGPRDTTMPTGLPMPDFRGRPLSRVHDEAGTRTVVHAVDVSGQGRIVRSPSGWRVCSHRPAAGAVFTGKPIKVMVVPSRERCP